MYWDGDDETIAVILNGYIMKVGEDQFYPVKNQTGSSIAKGTAVRFAGTVGASGRLLIAPFIADGSVSSSFFMGVTAEAIADGADGKVLYFGRIRGINTNAFNEGDVLYASTTVAGGFQTAVPLAPNNIVQVAAVINKSINQGVIFIRPSFGSNINQDEGVKIVSPTTGQLLQLQANGLWENKTKAQVLGGTSLQFVKGDGTLDSNTYQVTSEKGQPNGYASLDSNGKVPLVQINDALIGNVNFQGLWNAATNTPTLANPPASGTKGHYYIVSTAGTFASISFEVGDWIISDGTAWGKVDNTDAVSSVFGRTGNVTAANGDYTTAQVTESGNLYYTDGRARGALSFVAGSGAYNSTTGVITIPTNNNQIINGAGYITSAALGGYVQGSGTTDFLPKFTGASTIGNSAFFDGGGFGGFNSTGIGARTFVINAASGRPLALEVVEFANVHSMSLRPNNSGFNAISSNYLSGGTFLPLSLSARENNSDFVLQTNGNANFSNSLGVGAGISIGTTGTNNIIWNTAGGIKLGRTNVGPEDSLTQRWTGTLAYVEIAASSQWNGGVTILPNGGGNVGIATPNPNTGKLVVKSGESNSTGIVLERGDNTDKLVNIFSTTADGKISISSGANTRIFLDSVGPSYFTGGNLLVGTTTDAGFKLNVNGTGRFLDNLYVNSSAYPTNYSTSLRSDGSANGILQLGNNNINYILAGNTASGGFLSIRVNVSTESISSGTEALRLNSNATTTFSSLAGSGNRIVVANSAGTLISAVIGSGLAFDGTTLTATGGSSGSISGSGTSGTIALFTGTSSIGNSVITQTSGKVSINSGITDYHQLSVKSNGALSYQGLGVYSSSNDRFISMNHNGSEGFVETENAGSGVMTPLSFKTSGQIRLSIATGGNVLIGTTTDNSNKLRVNGTIFSDSSVTAVLDSVFNSVNIGRGGGSRLSNTRVGTTALNDNTTGNDNTAFGYQALSLNTSASQNTALGSMSLQLNTTGSNNTALGYIALQSNTTGTTNIAIGSFSLSSNTTGSENVAIGVISGTTNTIINNSILIGYGATALSNNQTNQIVIGHNATGNGNHSVTLGNSSIVRTILRGNVLVGTTTDSGSRLRIVGATNSSFDFGITINNLGNDSLFAVRDDGVITTGFMASGSPTNNTTSSAANMHVDTSGVLRRSTSSLKYKKNVESYEKGLNEVMQLKPVSYQGKNPADGNQNFAGLIAEEVHNLGLTEFVQYAKDGSPDALSYQNMIALLTKAIQELKQEIDTLKK
jgi:hypothetical protein